MPRANVEQRFFAKVQGDDATGCWIWTGSRNQQGYGQIGVDGKNVRAHRWAYEYLRAPIDPEWLSIDHLCSNPPCVNPWHLEPVTHFANMKRAGLRGHSRSKTRPRVEPGTIVELPPERPWIFREDPGVWIALPEGSVLWSSADEYEAATRGVAVNLVICHSDDKPSPELRRVGQLVYEWDTQRHVMWDGRDWADAQFRGGEWRIAETETT